MKILTQDFTHDCMYGSRKVGGGREQEDQQLLAWRRTMEKDRSRAGSRGGVLPIVCYTGRLPPKGVPFSSSRYVKG